MADTTRTSVVDFLGEVRDEVRKVTWPDREQLKESTLVIIVFVFLVAVVIWLMDLASRISLDGITSIFGG